MSKEPETSLDCKRLLEDIERRRDASISEPSRKGVLTSYFLEKLPLAEIYVKYDLYEQQRFPFSLGQYNHSDPCEKCGAPLISDFANRTASTKLEKIKGSGRNRRVVPIGPDDRVLVTPEGYKVHLPRCESCSHIADHRCQCDHCGQTRETMKRELVARYIEQLCSSQNAPEISELTAEQIFLIASRTARSSDQNLVTRSRREVALRYEKSDFLQLLPLTEAEATERLRKLGILKLKPESVADAIEMISPHDHVLHEDLLKYELPYKHENLHHRLIEAGRLLFMNAVTRESVIELMGKLAVSEALMFYARLSELYRMPFHPSESIAATIKSGIIEYGLFKTIFCIEKTVRFTVMLRDEKGHPPWDAANKGKSGLGNFWLNQNREKKGGIPYRFRDEKLFPEPPIVALFQEIFLPFTVEYGKVPLKQISAFGAVTSQLADIPV